MLWWNWFLIEIAYNLLFNLLVDMDTKNADEMYIGDVIKVKFYCLGGGKYGKVIGIYKEKN